MFRFTPPFHFRAPRCYFRSFGSPWLAASCCCGLRRALLLLLRLVLLRLGLLLLLLLVLHLHHKLLLLQQQLQLLLPCRVFCIWSYSECHVWSVHSYRR